MTDGIWYIVKTPYDIEEDRKQRIHSRLKNARIKTLLQQAMNESKNSNLDIKRIRKLLKFTLEIMENE